MHKESKIEMKRAIKRCCGNNFTDKIILDIGSMDVCGSYKTIIPKGNTYIGVDLSQGKNVDIIMHNEFEIPVENNYADIIMCGQCLEHCRNPFKLVKEMANKLKPKGFLFLVAPFIWDIHEFPIDCFRFLPSGMISLLVEADLECLDSYLVGMESKDNKFSIYCDCWGIGKKKV